MGIYGIEFHLGYNQNLGTFQEVCFFRNFLLSQISPPPMVKSHFENKIGNPFFLKTSGRGGST